ncbi:hypothetical protein B0O99DRAFT_650308 [Bisporella sp. PMI_857]|nr:hypothetical protein B0O99DRAFT_650308 [Bisporella sp. PMI_857]
MDAPKIGEDTVPFGDAVISLKDTCLGAETCEELFTPDSPHIGMGLDGLNQRISLILEATQKSGGVYLYANQQGCDGERLYYDGSAMIITNGEIVAQASQFSLNDVEVITAVVDLEEVRSHRFAPARGMQSIQAPKYQRVKTNFSLSAWEDFDPEIKPSRKVEPRYHAPEEEIALGPACWMWDYLRRSKAVSLLVPLSGGIDSASTSTLVFSMCTLVIQAIKGGNKQVIADVKRIAGPYEKDGWLPSSAQDLCNKIFHTICMGIAKELAKAIGAYHTEADIDDMYHGAKGILAGATGFEPKFKMYGGTPAENLALQNIQSRSRMVIAYTFAQMLPTTRKRPEAGSLLVLGSANVDECLRGYMTKYDCSSADINPIGGISKTDLKRFIAYAEKKLNLPILQEFLDATPTAELEPITKYYVQSDEIDMGMTYDEPSTFGRLRKTEMLGPYGMFQHLVHEWKPEMIDAREVAVKVKRFYHFFAINRHKMTTITPSYHAENYSPDDNRPFLYPGMYENYAFKKIDKMVEKIKAFKVKKVE